jgi:hypothetical protein
MHLEFLVEEASAKAALDNVVPRIVPAQVTFFVHPHDGKSDLLAKLPGRLHGYRSWMPADWRVIVLIDRDQPVANCQRVKQELEDKATAAGLWTRATAPPGQSFHVINRLAVEELEAWFFGDVPALVAAYPGISLHLGKQAKYRDPDAIAGGTWEALERVLQRAGYYSGGLPKIEVAARVSEHMDPDRNRSRSFQVFREALRNLAAETALNTLED